MRDESNNAQPGTRAALDAGGLRGVTDAEIAAFLDGRLDAARRDDVAGRIAADPEARLVLIDAARDLELPADTRGADGPAAAPVWWRAAAAATSRRVSPSARLLLATAAAILVGLGVLLLEREPAAASAPEWGAMLAREVGPAALADHVDASGANVFGFSPAANARARSFRLGRLQLDLEICLPATAEPCVASARAELERLLDEPARRRLALAIEASARGPQGAASPEIGRTLAAAASEPLHYAIGRWAEASRLAAATRSGAFFLAPGFDQALRDARSSPSSPEAAAALDEITGLLASQQPNLSALERSFEQLVLVY